MGKKIGIMQPYFLPYMGYWQLINFTDQFVVYDNIQYTKKGWINRNRFLQNGKDVLFSLPLKSDSDLLPVYERELAESYDREKLLRQFTESYKKAPAYKENFPVIESIIRCGSTNLSAYIENSIRELCCYFNIKTPIVISSSIEVDQNLKGKDKVLSICHELSAEEYINPIGGVDLYDKSEFEERGIHLSFLKSTPLEYDCFGSPAIPHMSILDVLMFNRRSDVIEYLNNFELV